MTFLAEYSRDVDYNYLMTLLLPAILPKVWSFALTSSGTFPALSVASITTHHRLFVLYP
jgi:hypothetical protein